MSNNTAYIFVFFQNFYFLQFIPLSHANLISCVEYDKFINYQTIAFLNFMYRLTFCHSFCLQQRISEILDAMGAASAKAQGLKGPITSGDKLRTQSEHIVYLLVDRESNAGRGSVVGLLKMGKKNLFLLDRQGEQVKMMTFHISFQNSFKAGLKRLVGQTQISLLLNIQRELNHYLYAKIVCNSWKSSTLEGKGQKYF